jgi:hypothetical protein
MQFSEFKRRDRPALAERSAVPTGFEPAISALTGPHVWPLHHGTLFYMRAEVYHTLPMSVKETPAIQFTIIYTLSTRTLKLLPSQRSCSIQ